MRYVSSISLALFLISVATGSLFVSAQTPLSTNTSEQVDGLNQEISQKKSSIQSINQKIKSYQDQIAKKQAEKASLSRELDVMDNRIAKTELEIQETDASIDLINTEIVLLQTQLSDLEVGLQHNKALMTGVLHEVQVSDQEIPLNVLFGSESIAELFDEMQALETISHDLKESLEKIKQTKLAVESNRAAEIEKKKRAEELQIALVQQKQHLEEEINAQGVLIAQTQRSEDAYRTLVQDLKEEQSFINSQITSLQKELEQKLQANPKAAGSSSTLTWPLNPSKRGISATFHDPTYPYRSLFEHSGIDLPASTGTPVKSAGTGYVAWTRRGTQYGNYVMIVHANGLATLYAHLSRVDVKVDQFVTPDTIIGAVGSTGLSTGPHLHFEVRKDGIPTNPMNYLGGY